MPELIWKGKEQVMNHHLEVPIRCLDRRSTYNAEQSENRIIHGDNLEALKALLPEYEGRVKCIYIDPPYNTGNESWVYNDNVKDPRIVRWLGEVVGKEGEDFCRHDKWLCMMYPRLQLLKRLLASDGAIFISIDDHECDFLKLVMDEIYGAGMFIGKFIWKSRQNKDNRNKTGVSIDHEYVLCYGKSLKGEQRNISQYSNPDSDSRGPWVSGNMVGLATRAQRPNLHYDLIDPETNINYGCPKKGWRYEPKSMAKKISEQRIIWPKSKGGRPRIKNYLHELQSQYTGYSSLIGQGVYTRNGSTDLREIFKDQVLDFPKPVSLLEELITQGVLDKDSIILDSFAGSGTTAHAVLNLNKKDNGNRKFILIEMMDYAETITAERVRRVIDGYGADNKAVSGTGGDFSYYTLGDRIFDDEDNLNESIGIAKIRDYVARTEQLPGAELGEHPAWLGEKNRTGYYFHYQPDQVTFLNMDFLATLTRKNEAYLIYADVCLLDSDFMHRHCIRFKKIPRDISRF